MNGLEALQNKTEARAFVLFLLSEQKRHKMDIKMIDRLIRKATRKFGITIRELQELDEASNKFVEW